MSLSIAQRTPIRNITRNFILNRDTTEVAFPGTALNEVRLKFAAAQSFNNCEVALIKAQLYYSWFNISSEIGNNVLTYSMPISAVDPTARVPIDVILPDGVYQIQDINQALQDDLQARGYYFAPIVNPTLPNIYPLKIVADPIRYRIKIISSPLDPPPNDNTTNPDDQYEWVAAPTTNIPYHPSLLIYPSVSGSAANAGGNSINQSSIGRVLGLGAGPDLANPAQYPAYTEDDPLPVITLGTFTPALTLQNILLFQCNLANEFNNNQYSQVLSQYSPIGSSGQPLEFQDQNPTWHNMNDGEVPYISVFVTDEHNIPIRVQDPIMCITLSVRQRSPLPI